MCKHVPSYLFKMKYTYKLDTKYSTLYRKQLFGFSCATGKKKNLQNILIKEKAYVAKLRITFCLKHFFRKTVVKA